MVKEYKSFGEIEARLKILKLQREIDKESLKLRCNRAKTDLISRKSLRNLGMIVTQSGTWKHVMLAFAIKKALGWLGKKRQNQIQA